MKMWHHEMQSNSHCCLKLVVLAWAVLLYTRAVADDVHLDSLTPDVRLLGGPQDSQRGPERLREGMKLDNVTGKFEVTGDRITFYPAGGWEPLRVLENLALERVARELPGIPRQREWRVTGLVTEYQGGNYLLVIRAILKST